MSVSVVWGFGRVAVCAQRVGPAADAARPSKGRPPRVADVALPLVARMVANAGCQGHKALSLAVHSKLPFVSMVRLAHTVERSSLEDVCDSAIFWL